MVLQLKAIRQEIDKGDVAGAESALVNLLRSDYENAEAWMLLGDICGNISRQAECYRQALRINPKNKRAKKELEKLLEADPAARERRKTRTMDEHAMVCPQCGGAMAVHFTGDLKDKRATCTFCGTVVDIPDAYRRVKKQRDQAWKLNGVHTVEDTVIESRQDGEKGIQGAKGMPAEIQEMLEEINAKGLKGIDDVMLQKLRMYGVRLSLGPEALTPAVLEALQGGDFDITIGSDPPSRKTLYIRREEHQPGILNQLISSQEEGQENKPLLAEMGTMKFLGIAPAPEDTRTCPNPACGATIPKNAKQCSWCGTKTQEH